MKRLICLAILPLMFAGCSRVMHELQPHRLWRMNYTDAPGRADGAYFSVDDELPPTASLASESNVDDDACRYSGR